MTILDRKPIFDAVRGIRQQGFTQREVDILDGAIDQALGLGRDEPDWMLEARRHIGLKEIPGKQHNPTIVNWNRQLGGWFTDDETPWCGTYVGHCIRTAGLEFPEHWYRARAWGDGWGQEVSPQKFSIVVFSRNGGGHVGFAIGQSDTDIYTLGGNQRNQVNIAPISRERLLGFYWPRGLTPVGIPLDTMSGGIRTVNEA